LGNATISDEESGYCGGGYVTGFIDSESGFSFWPIVVETTGYYRLALRYANGAEEDLPLSLQIDGQDVGEFSMRPTGNWSTWMVEGIDDILLREGGDHEILVWNSKSAEESPNIDWLALRLQGPLTRFEYLTIILDSLTNVMTPSMSQMSALLWMSTEDMMDWSSVTEREIVERYSLVQFYYSTEGDLWSSNNEWLSDFHVCDWYGVGCSEENFVTDLILGMF
jgi:hypothetical protein